MKSIYFKELKQFFSSPIGYLAMGLFFLLNSLFLWIIEGSYYFPTYGFADLTPFFNLAPWILIFFIAAISMKSFSEEFKSGTIEILLTKPLTLKQIVIEKFLAVWTIGKWMLIPTFIYVFSIQKLSIDGEIDYYNLLSAYFGLILLIGVFSSIGVFASSVTANQVIAFLTGLFLMFLMYYGWEGLGSFNLMGSLYLFIQKLSLNFHYQNFVKGLIKLSDVVYFISIMILFVSLTHINLKNRIER
jgi:ABC-2 type transport system permease protein